MDWPWRVSVEYSYQDASQLIQDTQREEAKETSLGVRNRHQKTTLGISYDFNSQFTSGISIPYVYNQRWEDYNKNLIYSGEGIGDISLFVRYWFSKQRKGFNPYLELSLGIPTGDSDQKYLEPKTNAEAYKKSYITPGSGTWNPAIALGFEKRFQESFDIYGRAQFIWTKGKNDAGYKPNDPLFVSLGSGYTIKNKGAYLLGVFGQFNYLYDDFSQEKRDGVTVKNTGGQWLEFEPGIWLSPNDGQLTFYASVPYNIFYNVNSLQTFAPWSLNLGIAYRF